MPEEVPEEIPAEVTEIEPAPTPEPEPAEVEESEAPAEPEVAHVRPVIPEPVVDLGPDPLPPTTRETPQQTALAVPPKPEVALDELKGWLEETSPEAAAENKTRILRRRRDGPRA